MTKVLPKVFHDAGENIREGGRSVLHADPGSGGIEFLRSWLEREQILVMHAAGAGGVGCGEELEEDQILAVDDSHGERSVPAPVDALFHTRWKSCQPLERWPSIQPMRLEPHVI